VRALRPQIQPINSLSTLLAPVIGADTGTLLVRNTRWVRKFFGSVKQLLASDQSLEKVRSMLPMMLRCRHCCAVYTWTTRKLAACAGPASAMC